MKNLLYSVFVSLFVLMGCQSEPRKITPEVPLVTAPMKIVAPKKVAADATTILSKKEVPILCYHNIKDFSSSASGMIKSYTVKPPAFAEQMKALADAGYHTILPEQLNNYLVFDGPLPEKPFMITFDDTREEEFTIGAAEMKE